MVLFRLNLVLHKCYCTLLPVAAVDSFVCIEVAFVEMVDSIAAAVGVVVGMVVAEIVDY